MTSICAETRDDLVAFVDGELDATRATAVSDHLASCAECESEFTLANFKRMKKILRKMQRNMLSLEAEKETIEEHLKAKRSATTRMKRPGSAWALTSVHGINRGA